EMAEATDFTTDATSGQRGLRAEYFKTEDMSGQPVSTRTEQHVNYGSGGRASLPEGTIASRWTGYYTPRDAGAHDIFVQATGEDGGFNRLYVDDKLVLDNWAVSRTLAGYVTLQLDAGAHKIVLEQHGRSGWLGAKLRLGVVRRGAGVDAEAKRMASKADVVVVAAGFDTTTESEGADRTFALPVGQDELIQEMTAANKNTIVVVTSGGGVDMSAWVDRVPALVEAWYPGQEGGTALAEILFGDVNPSGRLPVTFERRLEDNPAHDSYYPAADTKRVEYKEGVFVGYRGYEHNHTKPLFPFGYGLSYTTFEYGNLSINALPDAATGGAGGMLYQVSFNVKNTGKREGADVAQVYVGERAAKVARPVKELKGFAKITLRPGETRRVTFMLDRRAFSYYDADAKRWRADAGDFDVLVGRSSEQIELRGKLSLAEER
ncbi:MAG: beta-glucosidase, partial [Acidobacteriota bacterium]|nr:beta-glucosidase [Acidobacteriota bacterium]